MINKELETLLLQVQGLIIKSENCMEENRRDKHSYAFWYGYANALQVIEREIKIYLNSKNCLDAQNDEYEYGHNVNYSKSDEI